MKKTRIIAGAVVMASLGALVGGFQLPPAVRAAPVPGGVIDVADGEALASAVATAPPGTLIRLAPGDYPRLVVNRQIDGEPVRISGPRTARINQLLFNKAAGWQLDGVTVLGGPGRLMPLDIGLSRDILVSGVLLTGTTPGDGPGDEDSNGVTIRNCEGVVLAGSEITHVKQIAGVRDSFGVVIEGNRFTNAREGIMVRATHGLAIRHNSFQGWQPRFDLFEHPDMIQFMTQQVPTGSTMVTIAGNFLMAGRDSAIQGIFIRAEAYENGKEPLGYHRDFTIRNNVYYGSSRHGISMTNIRGVVAENNTVIGSPHAYVGNVPRDPTGRSSTGFQPSIMAQGITWGRIANNISALMAVRAEAWRTKDSNNFVYNPRMPGDERNPGRSFTAAITAGDLPLSAFAIRPGSDAARHGRGADITQVGPDAASRDLPALLAEARALAARAHTQDLTQDLPPPN
ncbi:MAG: hypothetical protein WCO11_07180 [Sphingomonadales bacterium]|jgi:nitrous oxidase accessory protein NosD